MKKENALTRDNGDERHDGRRGPVRLLVAEVRHAPATRPAGARGHQGGQGHLRRPREAGVLPGGPRARPRRLGGGAAVRLGDLPRGRRGVRGGARGRPRLHGLPARAPAQDRDQQPAGAGEPRDQAPLPLGPGVPLQGLDDAPDLRRADGRGGQVAAGEDVLAGVAGQGGPVGARAAVRGAAGGSGSTRPRR